MCHTGDQNKNKSAISVRLCKYKFAKSIRISSVPHKRDMNKHKFVTSTRSKVSMTRNVCDR